MGGDTRTPGIDISKMNEYDLMPICESLIRHHTENNVSYRLGDVTFRDDGTGSATFCPPSGEHDVFDGSTREEAIKLFKNCDFLVVNWYIPREIDEGQIELKTIIGKFRRHEILIQARTTQETVDYVTNRLREFDSGEAQA